MKPVRYRGGVVTFRIPDHWLELHGLEGGGEFHPDTPDGRALRIRVTTAQAPDLVTPEYVAAFARKANPNLVPEAFGAGHVCVREVHRTVEDGRSVLTHAWKIYNAVPPDHLRVVLFTYTLFAELENSSEVADELAMLEHEILSGQFAAELGA